MVTQIILIGLDQWVQETYFGGSTQLGFKFLNIIVMELEIV
jgi:hypothetical protein